MKKEPKVAIVIVTFNPEKKLVRGCLNSLKKLTDYKNYKVIISDNGSPDDFIKMMKKEFKWVEMIENGENFGFSKGANIGIKHALKRYNPDYFLLLNDDTKIIRKDWLGKLVKVGESNPKVGIVGGNLIYPDGTVQNARGYIKGPLIILEKDISGIKSVDHVGGGAFLIKRKVIEKVGLFDEIFTPYLLEETDYCLRTKRSGFEVISVADVKIIHYKSQTIESVDPEIKRVRIRIKNDLIFSLINLNLINAFLRMFIYLPLVIFLKKKEEKKKVSIINIKFRKNIPKNIENMVNGYKYIFNNWGLIRKKILERKKNKKIWY